VRKWRITQESITAWKNTKQLSLADALANQLKAITALDDVHALIDWERTRAS
jgi:hypothetical protein